jgi:hypothetical protein
MDNLKLLPLNNKEENEQIPPPPQLFSTQK